jgi:hypothetical protein
VKKEELAQAVAACDLDPVTAREGKDNLFKLEFYEQVFPKSDPDYLLPRLRLSWVVKSWSRGWPSRGYAKWVVLNFVWDQIESQVSGKKSARTFRMACERWDKTVADPLSKMVDLTFTAALRFYRASRGTGDEAVDVSTFFKRKGRHREFQAYWTRKAGPIRQKFEKAMETFTRGLAEADY